MAKKTTKKKSQPTKELKLENILFNCRDLLRGKAAMADKRDLLLTLVFLRFVGEKFTLQRNLLLQDQKSRGRDTEKAVTFMEQVLNTSEAYTKDGVFYLPEQCRWENISALPAIPSLATSLDTIINRLETDNDKLRGALPQKIFTKTGLEPKVMKAVIDEVGKISQQRFPERDLIGHVYEYFLKAFAFQVKDSKEEGEFYTPSSIVELIATIIEPVDGTVYDPCCGSGGMFVQSMKVIGAHGGNTREVSVYGQEMQPETYRLAKMNLAVRGISHDLGGKPVSTFDDDRHRDRKMDYVITNPPFNLKKWWTRADSDLISDPRWADYGVPPVSNANYAWILHILNKLNPTSGIAGFLLSNGALADGDTVGIRQRLIENDKVEAIIVLPRDMFYTTDISVTLWILNQNKRGGRWHGRRLRDRTGEVLFMDLRTWNQNTYEKKYVELKPEQIERVVSIYQTWQAEGTDGSHYVKPELYRSANRSEIEANGWSLAPSRYIEFMDRDTDTDYNAVLTAAAEKIRVLAEGMTRNQQQLKEALKTLGYGTKD